MIVEKTSAEYTRTAFELAVDIWQSYMGGAMENVNGPEMTNVSSGICE